MALFKADPTAAAALSGRKNEIGVNPKAFALRLRKICTDSDHQTAIAQDKNMMRFLLAQLKNADSSADMLIIVLQTLQFLLSHPSNVAFLYQTYPEFLTTVSDLTERDPPPIVAPAPAAGVTGAAAAAGGAAAAAAAEAALPAALVAQHNARWKTVQILSQQLLDSLAAYTNGDTTPKKPIRKPALARAPVTPISAGLSAGFGGAGAGAAAAAAGAAAASKKYMFTCVYEVKHDIQRVIKMANRDAIEKALVALNGVVSATINSEDPYTWLVTVYSTAKAEALTPCVQTALKDLKFEAALSKATAKAAAPATGNSENVPPPIATPSAVNRNAGAAAAAAAAASTASASYATPKKPAYGGGGYGQHKTADDDWDSRNDAQALVEFDGEAGEYDRDHSRYSLNARKQREQQQKQRDASKSSVLGFFSSVTSYFF